MKEIAKHVPNAGSYAPITILGDELPLPQGGLRLSYDRMASLLALTEALMPWRSLGISIRKSSIFFESVREVKHPQVCEFAC